MVVEFYTGSNPSSPANNYQGAGRYPIELVDVDASGIGYIGNRSLSCPPTKVLGVLCRPTLATDETLRDTNDSTVGKGVTSTRVINGGLYTRPQQQQFSGGAQVNVISRPHLRASTNATRSCRRHTRGQRRTYPIELSPVIEFNANEFLTPDGQIGCGSIEWTAPADPGREDGRPLKVELTESSANQATTLYQ